MERKAPASTCNSSRPLWQCCIAIGNSMANKRVSIVMSPILSAPHVNIPGTLYEITGIPVERSWPLEWHFPHFERRALLHNKILCAGVITKEKERKRGCKLNRICLNFFHCPCQVLSGRRKQDNKVVCSNLYLSTHCVTECVGLIQLTLPPLSLNLMLLDATSFWWHFSFNEVMKMAWKGYSEDLARLLWGPCPSKAKTRTSKSV